MVNLRKHFEWGEYDSVRQKSEMLLQDTSRTLPLKTAAQLHVYLGVAYYSLGHVQDARAEFFSAFELDSLVELQKVYVRNDMYELFMLAGKDFRLQKHTGMIQDSLEEIRRQRLVEKEVDDQWKRFRKQRRKKRVQIVTSFFISTVSASLSTYLYMKTNDLHENFQQAAYHGNLEYYQSLKTEIRRNDRLTVAAGVMSVVGVSVGIIELSHLLRIKQDYTLTHAFDR